MSDPVDTERSLPPESALADHEPAAAASAAETPAIPPVVDPDVFRQADFDELARTVLDAADVATQAARAATEAGTSLRSTVGEMTGLRGRMARDSAIFMGISGAVMGVAVVVMVIAAVWMVSRIEKLDAATRAVGKRTAALDAGLARLESLAQLPDRLTEIEVRQNALSKVQADIQARLERALTTSGASSDQLPQAIGRQQALSETVLRQVQALDARLQGQTAAVQALGREVRAMQGAVADVVAARRDPSGAAVTRDRPDAVRRLQTPGTGPTAGPVAVPATPPVSAMPPAPVRNEPPASRDVMVVYPRPGSRPPGSAEAGKTP